MGSPSHKDTTRTNSNESRHVTLPYYEERETLSPSLNFQQCNLPERHVTFQTPLPSRERDSNTTIGVGDETGSEQDRSDTASIPVIARNAAYPVWLAPLAKDQAHGGWRFDHRSASSKPVDRPSPSAPVGRVPTTAELIGSKTELSRDRHGDFAGYPAAPTQGGEQRREFILQQRLKASERDVSKLRQESLGMRLHLTHMIRTCLSQGSENLGEVDPKEDDDAESLALEKDRNACPEWFSAFGTKTDGELIHLLRNEIKNLKVEVRKSRFELMCKGAALEAKEDEMKKIKKECEFTIKEERDMHKNTRRNSRETAQRLEILQRSHDSANQKVKELSEKLHDAVHGRVYDISKLNAEHHDKLHKKDQEMQGQNEKSATEIEIKENKIAELKSYIDDMMKQYSEDTEAWTIDIANKTKTLSDLTKTIDEMREQLGRGKEEQHKLEEAIERKDEENGQFRKSLNHKSQLLNRATIELKRKHDELADRNPDLERKTKELKAKDDELKRHVEDNKWTKGQVSWYKHQCDTSQREIEMKTNQIKQLSSKHHKINLEVSELTNKSNTLLKRLKAAEEENQNLKKSLAVLHTNNSQARYEEVVPANSSTLSIADDVGSQSDSEKTAEAPEEDSDFVNEDEYDHLEGSISGDESYAMI